MTTLITIKIPRATVHPEEFAALEGVSVRTVYRQTTGENPRIPIEPRTIKKGNKRDGGPIRILYARYKEMEAKKNLGHSRFQIIIGA